MSASGDKEVLVHDPNSKHKISQKALIGCLIFGIAVVSLLIYGFIISLDLKSSHGLNPSDADLTDNAAEACPYSEFDYLLFAVRWPLSDCTEEECVPNVPNRWLVHGLWPNFANGSWPQFCCPGTPFNMRAIESLQPRLLVRPLILFPECCSSSDSDLADRRSGPIC